MEVVQGGGPLVCGPRATTSSTHPPLRLGHHHHHHRLEADGPASAALHVQTEEGGGGLDPGWWRISASGSWDGGERKMRYGKLIDDRPTGSIPGAVQRRKLELLETHAPGASMRVVHQQSHASWRQDGGDLSSGGLSSSTASRSLVSTSSSTRVTSYRQWSSNFSQTTSNVAASKQETTLPAVTEFGNLELALNPLDVSFLRTRGNVGRSGSIGSRRPPTRSRRLSSGAPSPDSQADSNPTSPEAKSPQSDFASDNNSSSPGESPDDRRGNEGRKSLDDSAASPVSESIRESVSRLMALGWHPPGAAMPPLPPLSPLRTNFSASTPLHRKRSVSSEELRSPDGGEGSDPEGDGLKWERGASVRRSLPSSEWRSAVGPAVDGGASRLLRPRDPLKSSSVPALGGPAATNRKGSLVTAESLREMKGRLKHRGSVELVPQAEGVTHSMSNGMELARKVELKSEEGPKVSLRAAKEDSIAQDDRRKSWSVGYRNVEKREVVNGEDNSGFASRRRSYVVEPTRKEELRSEEGPKVSLRAAKEDSIVQDDRRKSWSMGCRNVEKREVVNGEEDSGFANRRRSYAFEFSDDPKQSPSSPVKKDMDWLQLHNGEREEVGHRIMLKAITSDTSDFVQNRVNEMLKKWSALTGGSCEGDLNNRRASSSSPIMRRQEGRWSPAKNSSMTWLDHGDGSRSENGGDVERNGFSNPATTISGARTTLRLTHAKGHSSFEKETVSGTSRPLEKVLAIMDELPPSNSGHLVEDYSFPRGLSPVDWSDGDTSGILSIKEPLNKPELTTPATSAGISVTFSNSDAGDSHSSTSTRHHSVTHLESKEVDGTKTEGGLKVRTSKKVEFSKTEVHFAAESGRFHIVETAGKPPPSNNFRRRRRSPTGTLNVDSSAAGARAMLLGGPSALTNGMRFGDSPYEKRLLAGTDGAADTQPTSENEQEFGVEVLEEKQLTTNGDNHYEYGFTSSRTFEDLETKEEETKSSLEKMQDVDMTSSTVNFRHMISEDTTEKPRGILRVNPATSSNQSSWKPLLKMDDDSDDSSKPKFGGVRLRPVVSPELHARINLSSLESSDSSRILSTEKSQSSPLSPGQMELQKLLKSLRPVSVTPYADNFQESNDELGTQVANGGGMEVRITSGNQTAVANSVIISGDPSTEVLTPLSVAQRVREVEERRQRELREKLTANQKARTPGQFSTRVTLGPGSSSVVSVEPQVLSNKSIPPTLSSSPPSPKLTAKISAQSKISRIQTSPDKVGPLQIVRKGIHEETCRMRQSSEILASPQEKAVPKSEADSAPPPTFGCRFDPGWRAPLSPLHLEIAPLQPLVTRRLSSSSTSSRVDDMWFKGLLTTAQPTHHHPPPSASWPSARGFGRVGDDRVVLKSPSLILQTMLSTAFPPKESKETVRNETSMSHSRHEVVRTMAVDAFRVKEVHVEKKVEKVSKETLMTGDKLERNLSILRALYRDASEEECSDAYEAAGRLLGGRRTGGESRLGDGGSVVSGSWRRLKRAKAKQQQSSQRQAVESVPVQSPKPVPRKQSSKTKVKSNEPPRPPPRNHRSNAQARMKRTDAKGRAGTAWERADERTRRRGGGGLGGGGGDCGGKGDTSGFASDNVQHNLFDTKASTENCSRSEHIEEAPRIACIALGPQTRTKGVRDSKEAFTTKEDLSTGPTPSDAGHCNKIFSALCVSRDDEAIRTKNVKNEGVKLFTSTVEKTPEDPSHSRHREYKSASPSKQMTSSWPVGNSKITKEDTKSRSENLSSKDSFKSTRKVKEVTATTTSESQKKSQYSIMRSPPPQTKIFSGLFGGSPAYEKSVKATEVAEGMDGGYSVKLNVIEKRLEEVGPQSKTSKSEQPQRRSSLEEKSKKVEVTRTTTVGGTQVPKSPRLTETSRLSQLRQSSTSTTTSARPASPRLSPVVGDSGGSPSTGRAVRKRVRRRASGGGTDAIEDKRRGRKASTGGEEVSEESAILAELTRAADEILHAVNGYSDDPTSDEDAAKASAAAARSKRRTARVQHSKKSSSSSSNAVTTTKEVAKSTSSGAQRSTLTRTRSGGKENAASSAKERAQVKEVASSHEVKGSGANMKGQSSTASAGSPSGSPQVSHPTRGTALSSSFSEKEKAGRSKLQQHQGSVSPRTRSAMTRVEPTNRVAEVKLIEKRPPLPPGGQRRGKDGLKERTEVHTRTSHGKTKSAAGSNLSNGESEVKKSETKRTINIARALEAVMPDPRNKTRKVEKKTDEHSKKETPVLRPASPQLSPRISLSLERKKVASSREGDKTSRRGIPT